MARIRYIEWNPGADAVETIRQANAICADYRTQGYDLTLRQLYYQFVARGLIPNNQRSYKRLGDVVNKGRMAGLIDWSYIVDRTRALASVGHWEDPADIVNSAASGFRIDKWSDQPTRVEVWVEKEALAGVVGGVASRHDVAYFSCRGYVSQSELWGASQRLRRYIENGQDVVVLHLGDHDPSGIDMTRDITDRLEQFLIGDWLRLHDEWPGQDSVLHNDVRAAMRARTGGRGPIEVRRIALNYDQVEEYDPPPNPAKLTDSRVARYLDEHGDQSWELDALEPAVLDALIEDHILGLRDDDLWLAAQDVEDGHRGMLVSASERWAEVVEFLDEAAS